MSKTLVWCWSTTLLAIAGIVCLPGQSPAAPPRASRPEPHPAPAGRGSVHFAPAHVDVHRGPVGSVHFAPREVPHWGHLELHPRYAPEYFRRFRPGYLPLPIGADTYYYYPQLPADCVTTVSVAGQYYYFCDGIYYMPYLYGGNTIFVAVPPPA